MAHRHETAGPLGRDGGARQVDLPPAAGLDVDLVDFAGRAGAQPDPPTCVEPFARRQHDVVDAAQTRLGADEALRGLDGKRVARAAAEALEVNAGRKRLVE